jgi:hypothetical protein
VCAARALGSRELGELRAGPTVKLVTDSNFCLHGSAQRPAVMDGWDTELVQSSGGADLVIQRGLQDDGRGLKLRGW